jgi:peptidoglycan hydrolase-like protein with peptidoglycan-binding domain
MQSSGSGQIAYASTAAITSTALPSGAVVTRVAIPSGELVSAGAAVTELNGRPVFVFPGQFAFYRALAPSDQGPDVSQLQNGLRAAGYFISSSEDGTFGAGTASAVAALYRTAGYKAPTGLPLTEAAVTTGLPGRLVRAPAVGAHPSADAPISTVGSGDLIAHVSIGSSAFVNVKVGQTASLTLPGQASPVAAKVIGLAAATTSDGTSVVTLKPDPPLPPAALGQSVVAIITLDVVASRSLLVPSRAVARVGDGTYRVLVDAGAGSPGTAERAVPVRVLGTLNGQSAVKPARSSDLTVGSLVVVGDS